MPVNAKLYKRLLDNIEEFIDGYSATLVGFVHKPTRDFDGSVLNRIEEIGEAVFTALADPKHAEYANTVVGQETKIWVLGELVCKLGYGKSVNLPKDVLAAFEKLELGMKTAEENGKIVTAALDRLHQISAALAAHGTHNVIVNAARTADENTLLAEAIKLFTKYADEPVTWRMLRDGTYVFRGKSAGHAATPAKPCHGDLTEPRKLPLLIKEAKMLLKGRADAEKELGHGKAIIYPKKGVTASSVNETALRVAPRTVEKHLPIVPDVDKTSAPDTSKQYAIGTRVMHSVTGQIGTVVKHNPNDYNAPTVPYAPERLKPDWRCVRFDTGTRYVHISRLDDE